MANAEESFTRLLSALTAMPDDDVVRPDVQPWTEGQAVIDVVPSQAHRHYRQHVPPLRELVGMTTVSAGE